MSHVQTTNPRATSGRALTTSRRRAALAFLLMAPALALMAGALAYPAGWEVWLSLSDLSTRNPTGPAFVGFENYRRLAVDPEFWQASAVTVLYIAATTVVKLALGVAMALLLARPARWRAVVFLAVFLPWAYPGGVSIIAWYWILNPPITTAYAVPMGEVKYAVDGVLGHGAWAFLSVALFNVWRGASFTAVFLLAGLNAIPTELFEYAALETKSSWRRFVHVTLPLLKPYLALAVFLSFTTAFADLANVWMLTGGRIVLPLLGTRAYWLGIKAGQLAEGAAWSLSLVPLLALAMILLFHWFDPREEGVA